MSRNKVLSYIAFSTSEEFEKWQMDTPHQIINIYPAPAVYNHLHENYPGKINKGTTQINMGICVIYSKETTTNNVKP